MIPAREEVLYLIDKTIAKCSEVLESSSDSVVASKLQQLRILRSAVVQQWPLPVEQKGFRIGAVAAKNLYDWTPKLANAIMQLDFSLKNDGLHIDRVMADLDG